MLFRRKKQPTHCAWCGLRLNCIIDAPLRTYREGAWVHPLCKEQADAEEAWWWALA